ncbi:hypothetical protein LTR37_004409 [Vermiconidia calcicola]|uniref:Uncharacterized protein n=1 Tax=Vermiconidia calcicola TaxID=1690605 RepID=A0ACC3NMA8_9PEZI|nr:hypothetical protein LTR37_004409 [Vermiconidia calcicola]
MDSEDGQVFVKASNLAYFVRTHERALANALHLQHQRNKNGQQQATAGTSSNTTSIKLSEALSRPYLSFGSSSSSVKAAKLTLTPHHLFFLLSKFEDLGVDVGPMNVRLENLQYDAAPSNYVSFLGHAPKSRGRQTDTESLKSVSSVRSVMSSMSSLWTTMTMANSAAKAEKQMAQHREDIKYLYSCFTKIPALKLSPDHRARLISGFEEFPFDTAVPLFAFKNVSALEICDLDFRQFHGWDRLSEQLRSLTVKRSNLDDPIDLLQHIVLDDMEKRRKRSFKNQLPATPPTPCGPWPTNSPKARQIELARTYSAPNSPFVPGSSSKGSPQSFVLDRKVSSNGKNSTTSKPRQRSNSPPRTPSSRHDSLTKHGRTGSLKYRRSSGSSGSSTNEMTPRHSTSDLVALGILPPSKWRLLRHLSLAENALTSLTMASLAPVVGTLQSLDLSGNLFTEVPDALASLTHLRALNLSNCMIGSLQTLSRNPLPAITTLNLRSNRLQNLAGIERLLSLERVDVRDNRLRDPMELARLAALPDIVDLYVMKNPFTKTHADYRVTIFNAFRSTPGHLHDVTIDTLGPLYTEKKHMVDRAPEATNVPVVKPPLEDEDEPQAVAGGAPTEAESRTPVSEHQQAPSARHGHRRATSDLGPLAMRRKKKAPRRRIVELSQAESPASATSTPKQPAQQPTLDLTDMPRTPTDSDHPSTPGDTPYHTAPTTQIQHRTPPQRPTLDTSFTSPTPAPKIRDPSDDDLSPAQSPQDLGHSDIYRQKIEALKSELGPNWLTALNEDRLAEEHDKSRGLSPASRTSTIRPDNKSNNDRSVSVSGRTLG